MAGMTLDHFFAPLELLGAIGALILAPIQWRAGKKKHFWVMLFCALGMLAFAISSW
jgi:hypothetical protein